MGLAPAFAFYVDHKMSAAAGELRSSIGRHLYPTAALVISVGLGEKLEGHIGGTPYCPMMPGKTEHWLQTPLAESIIKGSN